MTRDDVTLNQAAWDGVSDEYQREHGAQLGVEEIVWGGWSIPETTYEGSVPIEWARRWPSENIWVARKRG